MHGNATLRVHVFHRHTIRENVIQFDNVETKGRHRFTSICFVFFQPSGLVFLC